MINIYGKGSFGLKLDVKVIIVMMWDGMLSLGILLVSLMFGILMILFKEILYQLINVWNIIVNDIWKIGLQWYLWVIVIVMKFSMWIMSGNLIYLNVGNKQVLMNILVIVSFGKKIVGMMSINVVSGWLSSQGILLDV